MKKFTLKMPPEIVTALSRRHNGREDITREQILDGRIEMQMLWDSYQKVRDKLDYVDDVWWDEMKIEESQFSNPQRFYYGHRKRKKLMAQKKELHKRMFYLLVYTDGNRETFSEYDSLCAEDCYLDFMDKYKSMTHDCKKKHPWDYCETCLQETDRVRRGRREEQAAFLNRIKK